MKTAALSLSILVADQFSISSGFVVSSSCSHKKSPAQNTLRYRNGPLLLSSTENDDEATSSNHQVPIKNKSRLAQLAEDWLEEEAEDELMSYWDRFDTNRVSSAGETKTFMIQKNATATEAEELALTTEERLERYFDRRGINKALEAQYASDIEAAIRQAQRAGTPGEAMNALREVQPWLQANTRLGGQALYELAVALWQEEVLKSKVNTTAIEIREEGILPQGDAASILETLMNNPHMKDQVLQLMKQKRPPIRTTKKSNIFGSWGDAFSNPQNWWT